MSLINDALKRAQQSPPVIAPAAQPTLQPVAAAHKPVSAAHWLIPAVVILLVVAALFFIGWGMAHRSITSEAVVPETKPVMSEEVRAPTVTEEKPIPRPPAAVTPVPVQTSEIPVPVNPLFAPKLQGIFYSPTDPTAILDGKTVHRGDTYKKYLVKEISPSSVTLIGADQKAIKVTMDN